MAQKDQKKSTYRLPSLSPPDDLKKEQDPTTRGLNDFLRTLCEEIEFLGTITSQHEASVNRLRAYEMDSSSIVGISGDIPSQGIINDLWSARERLVTIRKRLNDAQSALELYVNT